MVIQRKPDTIPVEQKLDDLRATVLDAHYLALALKQLARDPSFVDRRICSVTADLLHCWAKRQSERLEAEQPCFREMRIVRKDVNAA